MKFIIGVSIEFEERFKGRKPWLFKLYFAGVVSLLS